MSEMIGGHDVEALKWAIKTHVDEDLPTCGCESARCQAQLVADDPAKLAAIMADVFRVLGLEYEVYAEHGTRVVVRIPDPTWPNMPRYCSHTLPSARALLLAILESDRTPETVIRLM